MHAGVFAWLQQRGYWVAKHEVAGQALTHVFLDGGKARVPDAHLAEFTAMYSSAVAAGACLHAVERLPAVFRMFLDVDGCDDVRRILQALPPPLRVGCAIVCTKRGQHRKPGAHIIWEDVLVNAQQALVLRAALLAQDEGLASHLDASVYRSGGLRMAWSFKGPRETDVPSFYEPTQVYDPTTQSLDDVDVDRTDAQAVGVWLSRISLLGACADPIEMPGGDDGDAQTVQIVGDDDDDAMVRRILGACGPLGLAYTGCTFERLVWNGSKSMLNVRTDSRTCHIGLARGAAPRQHRSNRVVLLVTASDVYQYCYCRCEGAVCADPGARAHVGRHDGAAWPHPVPATAGYSPDVAPASVVPVQSSALDRMRACAASRQRRR